MRTRWVLSLIGLTVAGVVAACNSVGETDEQVATVTDSAAIVDWETFRASARAIPDHGLVVEGDLFFQTEQELYDYWLDELSGMGGQALTVKTTTANGATVDDIWAFPKRLNLTYCVGANFPTAYNAQLLSALSAATMTWRQVAAVRFERKTVSGTCDSNNTSVDFDVKYTTEAGLCGRAFYPSEQRAGTRRTLEVGEDAFAAAEHCRTLKSTLLHEFGHIMGFRHEHIWGTMAGEGCVEGGSNQNRRLIPYPNDPTDPVVAHDRLSIMYYHWCGTPPPGASNTGALSIRDRFGATLLYGLAPAVSSGVTNTFITILN